MSAIDNWLHRPSWLSWYAHHVLYFWAIWLDRPIDSWSFQHAMLFWGVDTLEDWKRL